MPSRIENSGEGEAESQRLREKVRQWKAGMEGANRFTLEEDRRRTPAERFGNHQRFLEGDASYGLARENPEDRLHQTPYHELQERWLARHSERLLGN